MWNKSISILAKVNVETDKDGYDIESKEWMEGIPANFKDTTRQDSIVANQMGYSADQNIEVVAANYNGQRIIRDEEDGTEYEVKRVYHPDKSMNILLTCERREPGGKI